MSASHPRIVIKISCHRIRDSLELLHAAPKLAKPFESRYRFEAREHTHQLFRLRSAFGADHTLQERRCFLIVPLSQSIVQELFRNDYRGRSPNSAMLSMMQAPTIAAIQRTTPFASESRRLSLSFGSFPEDDLPDNELYQRVTNLTLLNQVKTPGFTDEFCRLQDLSQEGAMTKLLVAAKRDSSLRAAIEHFLLATTRFVADTGQILALAGQDNVVFVPTISGWTYLLIDALPAVTRPILTMAWHIAQSVGRSASALNRDEKAVLKRAVNFLRTINGLSMAIDAEVRIRGGIEIAALAVAHDLAEPRKPTLTSG
jgi:hypothetical protein